MADNRPPPGWGQGYHRAGNPAPVSWGGASRPPEPDPRRADLDLPPVGYLGHPADQLELLQQQQADLGRLRAEVEAWRAVLLQGVRWHLGRALAKLPPEWPAQATPEAWQEFLERCRWSDPPQPPIVLEPAPVPPEVDPPPEPSAAAGPPDIVAAPVVSPMEGRGGPAEASAGRRHYLRQQYQWEAPPALSSMGLKAATLYFERRPGELARFVKQIKQETQLEAGLSPADATQGVAELVAAGVLAEAEWEDRTMLLPGPQWPAQLAHPWTEIGRHWPEPLWNLEQSVHSRQRHGLRLNHNQLCYLALRTPAEALGGDLTLGEGDISLISARTGVAWLVVDSLRWESAQHRSSLLAALQTQTQAGQGLHLITFGVSERTELSQLLHTQVLSGLGYALDSDDLAPIGTQINSGPDL